MNRKQRRTQAKAASKAVATASPQTITVLQAFDTALRHHQKGRLAEAEALCRRILSADAGHADSLHLLGVIATKWGGMTSLLI